MVPFMFAAALTACAVLRVARLVHPPRPDLLAEVGHWDSARARATRATTPTSQSGHTGHQASSQRSATDRWGRWVAEQVQARGRYLTSLTTDLEITDGTLEGHFSKSLTLAGIGFIGPIAILTFLDTLGLGLPLMFGPIAGIGLAGSMVVITGRELHENAERRRAEFRRTLSTYLDLVAMSMQAGRGHAEALPASAAIGNGWAFTHLQDTIDQARFAGTTAWAALGHLGTRLGVRELTDLDAALALANDDGAKVRATLTARAETLRAQRLADAEASAAHRTESMKFALIVMVFVFLTYELYPSVSRLFAG